MSKCHFKIFKTKVSFEWPQGSLPSNNEANPCKQCKAITLRSGREVKARPNTSPHAENRKEHGERCNFQPYAVCSLDIMTHTLVAWAAVCSLDITTCVVAPSLITLK